MDQYLQFRHAFVEERMYNDTYRANKGHQAMDLILSTLCMILCNRVPKGLVQFRTENLSAKIKLMSTPKGVEAFERVEVQKVPVSAECPTGEQEVKIEKNTNERAVVRILVPKRTMTMSEMRDKEEEEKGTPGKDGEEGASQQPSSPVASNKSKPAEVSAKDGGADGRASTSQLREDTSGMLNRDASERIVEVDQDDRAVTVGNRINLSQPYMVLCMNQYAARAHRIDFVEQIRSKTVEYFTENPKAARLITEAANAEAEATDEAFIAANCDQYTLPCLDFPVNANENE